MTLRLPGRWPLPWQRRGALALAVATVLALAAGMVVGVQVRAAQAEDRRAALAAEQAAQEARAAQERTERLAALAQARLDAFERGDRVAAWAVAELAAHSALADADAAWAESEGAVADDAVRQALAEASAALRALLETAPDEPEPAVTAAVTEATSALRAAADAVAQSRAERQAADEAAAAATAAQAQTRLAGGPDCGGPDIREPAKPGPGLGVSVPTEEGDGSNGNLPRSAMTPLGWCADAAGNQQWLRTDAAQALVRLNDAFRAEFGENIGIDLSYRSYADQVRARELFGSLAARPGTSNHGWGTAFDTWEWAAYDFGSARYEWLVANGPAYGWYNLALLDPGNPEYWHFEYRG